MMVGRNGAPQQGFNKLQDVLGICGRLERSLPKVVTCGSGRQVGMEGFMEKSGVGVVPQSGKKSMEGFMEKSSVGVVPRSRKKREQKYDKEIQLLFGEQQPGACYFLKSLDQRLKETSPVTLEQNTARIPGEDYTCLFERTGEVREAAVLKGEEGSGFELC
ncbi:hypothetical protein NDU88_004290 [Pleurodeles waltl]|uniref:Uncharacterized protein n=1 Tax=Pleurodeles waltl TaxID=8319 RepID=A0AAV7T7F5_PLEWA|nr:hypothetical protein NDU88_004290 [Pleurodeles waltl]